TPTNPPKDKEEKKRTTNPDLAVCREDDPPAEEPPKSEQPGSSPNQPDPPQQNVIPGPDDMGALPPVIEERFREITERLEQHFRPHARPVAGSTKQDYDTTSNPNPFEVDHSIPEGARLIGEGVTDPTGEGNTN